MNHVYIVADRDSSYVFRVYTHSWRTRTEIEQDLKFLLHLKHCDTPVSFPIADIDKALIQEFEAPEGKRFGVLYSYAPGSKISRFSSNASRQIGIALANVHAASENYILDRPRYSPTSLIKEPLAKIKKFFSEAPDEIRFLESLAEILLDQFETADCDNLRYGAVHLDVWFDNLHIDKDDNVTFFDFDFCGNGWLCLDASYFLYQLLATNLNENEYHAKAKSFLKGYEWRIKMSDQEKALLPYGCLATMIYYISVQIDRFNYWTNIFVSEHHLKRIISNMKRWMDINNIANR